MATNKKIAVSLPYHLLQEIDDAVCLNCGNRSEFVRNAMSFYLKEIKRTTRIETMKNGYLEMSEINIRLSEVGFSTDIETILSYELALSERE